MDPHQVNTIIAHTVCRFFKEAGERTIEAEQAKLLGKQIVEALTDAGLTVEVASGLNVEASSP